MSKASDSRTIKFVTKAGTYTAWLASPSGDLYQDYDLATSDAKCTPDWTSAATKPLLELTVISSRTAVGEVSVADGDITWYVNDSALTFSGGVSTGTWSGIFQKTTSSDRQALKILKNVAIVAGFAPVTIKAVAAISEGNTSDQLQVSYTIPIAQKSGESYRVTIQSADSNHFVISEDGGSCKLKAVVIYNGSEKTFSGATYQWYKLSGSSWTAISGATSQTLTVSEGDVETYGEYKVTVKIPEVDDTISDVQGVMDTTDPYVIDANPTPQDESITEGSGGKVTYSPTLKTRAGGTVSTQPTWSYMIRDSHGVVLGTTNTVTEDMCVQAGGDVAITITAED